MEEGKLFSRFGRLALSGMFLVLVLALAACGGSSPRHESAEKREHAGESASERGRGAEQLKSGPRTLFESARRPDHTPAAEAVEDRAYPRTYVETRRALAGRKAAARARARFAVRR